MAIEIVLPTCRILRLREDLIYIQSLDEQFNVEHAEMFNLALDNIYKSQTIPFFIAHDMRRAARYIPADARKVLSDWLRDNRAMVQERTMSMAYIASDTMHREALKAIFAIQGYPADYKVVTSQAEALSYFEHKGMEPFREPIVFKTGPLG